MDGSLVILLIVLLLITCQQLLPVLIPIWLVMLVGAVADIVFNQITGSQAWMAISWNIMGFLFGVFVIVQFLERVRITGYLTNRLLERGYSQFVLLAGFILISAVTSMVLMNDAVAIVGVPVALRMARAFNMKSAPWLLALAFSVTLGSVMSPIGNPQNLLIAVNSQIERPFYQFFTVFFWPAVLCLGILFFAILLRYYPCWKKSQRLLNCKDNQLVVKPRDKRVALVSIGIFLLGIVIKVALLSMLSSVQVPFSFAALAGAIPILFFSTRRWSVLKDMDWRTLVFFMAMFIVMHSVWLSSAVQMKVQHLPSSLLTVSHVLGLSTVLSQLISNVPTAALFLPVLKHLAARSFHYLALVCGATVSGMLTVVGAASNVIVLQNAQQRGEVGFSAIEFMAVGLPLGLISLGVFYLFLMR